MKQIDIPITSEIKVVNGQPRLLINNQLTITDSYISYIDENADYGAFSKIGFNLFSVSIFNHSRIINENTKLEPFMKGVLDSEDNIKIIDKKIESILAINPNAYIFPRLNIELSLDWEKENPEELNDNPLYSGDCRACLSSSKWLNKVKEEIKTVITYIQNQEFAKNVIGYQIAGGMTEEWMAFDYNGSQGKRSRELFKKYVKEGIYVDNEFQYRKFLNDQIANVICELASYVKKLTLNRLIVGSFYGYSYALSSWQFGHSSLEKLLNSKDIDFICSPLSYWTSREVGEPHPYMTPVASINLHEKMYFAENDTRTHLSTFFSTNPNYCTPIWKGPNEDFSLEMLKYHYGKALTHQTSYWWFDLWGGWYKKDSYLSLFKKLLSISKSNLNIESCSLHEVAVLIDENEALFDNELLESSKTRRDPLKSVEKAGVSIDLYLSSDFKNIKNLYKSWIILSNNPTFEIKNIISYLTKHKSKYLLINETNNMITTNQIRSFYKESGIFTYDVDVVVDENSNYLSIYGAEDGTIKLKNEKYIDLINGVIISGDIRVERGKCNLFFKLNK